MSWKKRVDEVDVFCRKCEYLMLLEGTRNGKDHIFTCPVCEEQVKIRIV